MSFGLIKLTKDGFFDFLKDARKHFFWVLLALICYLVAIVYRVRLGATAPATNEEWFRLIISIPELLLNWVGDYPLTASLFGLMLAGYIILVVLLNKANKRIRSNEDILKNGAKYKALIEEIGLSSWSPKPAVNGSGGSWDVVKDAIARNDNAFVYVLGANGIDTFGGSHSPLYDALAHFNGTIRVILCDPKASETKSRAEALNIKITEYKKAINQSVQRLNALRKMRKPVEGKYYSGQPNWKIIMTSHMLWLQYYSPGGKNVSENPVYIFSATNSESNIYRLFNMEFERIWRRCNDKIMPLS